MAKVNKWKQIDLEKINKLLDSDKGKVVLGIDGIIDQVWQIIETRISKDDYQLFTRMKDFGEAIVSRGEGGMANEIVSKRRCCGGFTGNTGRALGTLSVDTVMLGMYGAGYIDPVFDEFKDKCTLISLGEPAVANIFEFPDGKIMMPYLENLLNLDLNRLNQLGEEKLQDIFSGAELISLGYWSNMPNFNQIILSLYQDYFADGYPNRMFFDFANLAKRSTKDLRESLELLGNMNQDIPMTLSLNKHEAGLLFSAYGEEYSEEIEGVADTALKLRKEINLDEIIIHTPYFAVGVAEDIEILEQDYCEEPAKTTGAGDTFNGGYMAACLANGQLLDKLAIANATTGFYVRNGIPPTNEELLTELKRIANKLTN